MVLSVLNDLPAFQSGLQVILGHIPVGVVGIEVVESEVDFLLF